MVDYVQIWGFDTCGCLVHQAGDQDTPDAERIMRYVTYEEARRIHAWHFDVRPESTNVQTWWQSPPRAARRRGEPWEPITALIQPRPRLCQWHKHLGFTQEMYQTVKTLNNRKNDSRWLAWRIGNDVSDEDLQWVQLGNTEKPWPYKEPGTGRIYMSTEREERMKSLTTVFPQDAVFWSIKQPGDYVHLHHLRDWLLESTANAIQSACDATFGPGMVVVN